MRGGPKGRPSKKELIKMIYRKLERVNYELYVKFSNLSKRCIPYAIMESVYQHPHPYEMIFTVSDELSKEEESNYEMIFILIYYFKIDMNFGSS